MNNYPYRIFQGPVLPFVGGLLVGGIFGKNNNNNQVQPQPMYPPYYYQVPPYPVYPPYQPIPQPNQPAQQLNIYNPNYGPKIMQATPEQVYYPSVEQIYYLNEPTLIHYNNE